MSFILKKLRLFQSCKWRSFLFRFAFNPGQRPAPPRAGRSIRFGRSQCREAAVVPIRLPGGESVPSRQSRPLSPAQLNRFPRRRAHSPGAVFPWFVWLDIRIRQWWESMCKQKVAYNQFKNQ
jgi:hypothetical protein